MKESNQQLVNTCWFYTWKIAIMDMVAHMNDWLIDYNGMSICQVLFYI